MDWYVFFESLFWFLVALGLVDVVCLNGLFLTAIATRISGEKKDD